MVQKNPQGAAISGQKKTTLAKIHTLRQMTQVNLHHLSKTYDNDHKAVANLSLEVPSGSITALLGPSGCGKTTTLKMIAGLLRPTAGDICFDGQSILHVPAEKRGAVMVFQNHLLFPYMSVLDNVAFGLKMRGESKKSIRERVSKMLALVQLSGYENRRPKQLSGGQQQRVALARALIVEPVVLLLDEPLSNLDAHLRDEMRELIVGLQRKLHITTIFVTHDQEEAVVLADKVALLFDGQLQQYSPPRAFYERPANARTARFFGGVNFVPGTQHGPQVKTALGNFESTRHPLPDGPVLLAIRPENLQLRPADSPPRPNSLRGEGEAVIYVGTHTRFKVKTAQHRFEVVAQAADSQHYHRCQSVQLHLPADKIWLVPPE
jgi:ABC-type Fe3+/spermidine/putrescine transport system ATPase subunit